MPEPSRWGTFCAMEQQACDLLVTASRMLGGAEQSVAPGDAAVAVRDGKILETGGQVDARRPQRFGECAADAGAY